MSHFMKIYPQITHPASGETITRATYPSNFAVEIRTNTHTHSHRVRLYTEAGQPIPNTDVEVQFTIVNGKWIGTANIPTPQADGNYIIYCYIAGDNLLHPNHHITRVAITVSQ